MTAAHMRIRVMDLMRDYHGTIVLDEIEDVETRILNDITTMMETVDTNWTHPGEPSIRDYAFYVASFLRNKYAV